MQLFLPKLRVTFSKIIVLFFAMISIANLGWGQLFQQQFSTDLTAFSNSTLTTGIYANLAFKCSVYWIYFLRFWVGY